MMSLDKILVIVSGIIAIGVTYWFFLRRTQKIVHVRDQIEIEVAGGYSPEVIEAPKNKPLSITFLRKDPSTCLEEVILPDFKIRKHLPLNKKLTITVTPTKSGTYVFTCGMNMYHGKILVA